MLIVRVRNLLKRVLNFKQDSHSVERLLLHDKSKFYVHGDKLNKLLATLLKGSGNRQTISKIQTHDGSVVTDHWEINDVFRDFYSEVYSSQSQINSSMVDDFPAKLTIPVVPPELKNRFDEPISQS